MAKKTSIKKKESDKVTKAQLMKLIDEKLTALNLIKSALQVDPSRTQETLLNYQKRFEEVISGKE
jgi:hypothetical protein